MIFHIIQFVVLSPFLYTFHKTLWGCALIEVAFCPFLLQAFGVTTLKAALKSEMTPPNIPYQIVLLTRWLLQSRDQWPPQMMTLSFVQEWRQCWLRQITRRQLCCSCSLGSLSPHSDMPFDFTTNHSAAAEPSHVGNHVFGHSSFILGHFLSCILWFCHKISPSHFV